MRRTPKRTPWLGSIDCNPGAGNIASGFKFDDDCTFFARKIRWCGRGRGKLDERGKETCHVGWVSCCWICHLESARKKEEITRSHKNRWSSFSPYLHDYPWYRRHWKQKFHQHLSILVCSPCGSPVYLVDGHLGHHTDSCSKVSIDSKAIELVFFLVFWWWQPEFQQVSPYPPQKNGEISFKSLCRFFFGMYPSCWASNSMGNSPRVFTCILLHTRVLFSRTKSKLCGKSLQLGAKIGPTNATS